MLEGGVPFSVVADIMGWSPGTVILMARRYGHIGQTARQKAVDKLDDHCEETLPPLNKTP